MAERRDDEREHLDRQEGPAGPDGLDSHDGRDRQDRSEGQTNSEEVDARPDGDAHTIRDYQDAALSSHVSDEAPSDAGDAAATQAGDAPADTSSVEQQASAETTDENSSQVDEATSGDSAETSADEPATGADAIDSDAIDSHATNSDAMNEIVAALDAAEAEEEFKRPAAELNAIVEALIFASPDPLTPKALLKLLDNEPKEDVLAALEELKQDYERPGGLQLVEVAGGFQIVTRPDLHEWVRRLFHERSTQKLSVAALETLAVIAYRQPITAVEITEIRGVNTSGVLNTLLERHLIKIVGRKQVVGRPFMYGTTKEFLVRFGLRDLTDLPKVEDMAESLGIESTLLVERTPPEEQLPLSEPDADAMSSGEPDVDIDDVDDEPSVH